MAGTSFSKLVVALAALPVARVYAAVRTYDFNVTWVNNINPDNLQARRVQGINGQWPIPQISCDVGDQVVVNLYNGLGDAATSLHFHGLYQNGTTHMDGPGQANQCPIPPGSTFTYNFTVNQPGTYWYHSHVDGQYPDGLRGAFIVNDPQNPYKDLFDEEIVLTLSDWYHDEMSVLKKRFLSVSNPTGAEPVPNSALMNDTQDLQIPVQAGRTYFMRVVNMAAFAAQYFWIEGHTFRIIEVDGVYHEPTEAEQVYITAAQRYGILVTMKNTTDQNYAIVGSMDQDLFDKVPDGLNPNVTSFLVYDATKEMPKPADIDAFEPFDDLTLVPTDKLALFENPVRTVSVDVMMDNLGDGANYAFFNGITYVRPKVPTLYTVLSAGELATNEAIYGENTHSFVLGHNEVYEMVVNNHDPGKHPFHLHGHDFQAIVRSDEEAGDWDPTALTNGSLVLPATPMRRDTLLVRPNGHFVIRFRSDNPGVWLFHCHIEWHVVSGLTMTFIEAPMQLQQNLTIPEDHFSACKALQPPMPTTGNAAGNTVDYLNLDGANVPPAPLPEGFTTRGIVALVFSIIAGLLGVSVIAWYGVGEMGAIEKEKGERKVAALTAAGASPNGTVVSKTASIESTGAAAAAPTTTSSSSTPIHNSTTHEIRPST